MNGTMYILTEDNPIRIVGDQLGVNPNTFDGKSSSQ